MITYYKFICWIVRVVFRRRYKLEATGIDNPYVGGAIIAPNHVSHLDPMAVAVIWPQELEFFARHTLFKGFWGWLFPRIHTHPIIRDEADIAAMKKIIRLLKEGKKVVLFPEGTRSDDGELQEAKDGVAMLALRAGVPIIPAYVAGTYEIFKRGEKKPKKHGKIICHFGTPIHPSEFTHLSRHDAKSALTNRTMEAISQLKEE